ncbi:beta-galactosidase-1-like protein 3 [Anoplophora glabripennis]|uniref:beta-galactosidase-1-like protein 3 n=1 Tax=Anoplophora glabripennis TaxID=217634 RepID=UPI000874B76D|nr:beta-galactosidase-1-like protein 3 [Anoplophora glabripennis]
MANLPTLYEHYTSGGITQGLSVDQPYFTLNDKNISLYSGAMHYFRVPQEYWRDRLRKMRAAGLNAVETYVPWNLHEPQPGVYDFGQGGTDMQDFLDIEKFLKTAQEEDLLAIVRPGPFICAEFEFGGLPSYLLREKDIKFRTSDEKYMSHVRRYFNVLLALLASLQFTKGGPIIAFQIENEYGSTETKRANPPFVPDSVYVEQLRQLFLDNNIKELLFTSDSPYDHGSVGSLPSLFQTANFNSNPEQQFDKLKTLQKDKPSMSMEYWSGWFNHWSEKKYVGDVKQFKDVYERILKYPASVNLYMFHGGTSFGFVNGANIDSGVYTPDITSYDYDAPLSEFGNYTEKYFVVKELLDKYNGVKTKLPDLPGVRELSTYPSIKIEQYIGYSQLIEKLPHKIDNKDLITMENLSINNNTGQSFGYIVYRKNNIIIIKDSLLKILGYVQDSVNVYVNNKLITKNVVDLNSFGYWKVENSTLDLSSEEDLSNATLDLVVGNLGRNNFGSLDQFYQFKGLSKGVVLDEQKIEDWEIFPMEFKKSWNKNLSGWAPIEDNVPVGAGLYKAVLVLEETNDTFLDMSGWNKGIVIVNNFVLGRYWKVGPQQSLYLPAPLLKVGDNEIVVFEEFSPNKELVFSKTPVYGNNFINTIKK